VRFKIILEVCPKATLGALESFLFLHFSMHFLQVSFVLFLSVEVLTAAVELAADFDVFVATGDVIMQPLFMGVRLLTVDALKLLSH
jgi:hypothetical protein